MIDDSYQSDLSERSEQPIDLAHFVHTIRAYRFVIFVTLAVVTVVYSIIAITAYLVAPYQKLTEQQFRLDFKGAESGEYPNHVKFSGADIVAQPILLHVFATNHLERFTSFGAFSRSIFVLEANPAYDALVAEYRPRLNDPKLTPVDRERIQNEFEAKRASLKKNEYSISLVRTPETTTLPETLVRKSLTDILDEWARFVVTEQHVLDLRVSLLSPDVVTPTAIEQSDVIVGLQVLRASVKRVIENIDDLQQVPGAENARTNIDHMSLAEIRLRLEDMIRFRLDPLVGLSRSSRLVTNPALTIRFLESQLNYDQRQLDRAQAEADSIRQALAVYTEQRPAPISSGEAASITKKNEPAQGSSESVTPQLSDSFLDRLVALSTQSGDVAYRQKLVDDFRTAQKSIIPAQEAVSYDKEVLAELRSPIPAGGADSIAVRAQLASTRTDIRGLIEKVNEIYQLMSRSLNPSTQLFTLTAPPITRVERQVDRTRLLLYLPLLLLVTLPITIVLCLLHNRLREEETEERLQHKATTAEVAG